MDLEYSNLEVGEPIQANEPQKNFDFWRNITLPNPGQLTNLYTFFTHYGKRIRSKSHILGENSQGVYALVEVTNFQTPFVLTAIYASPKFHIRQQLWHDLCTFANNLNHHWILLGDFNEVTYQQEKFGGRGVNRKRVDLYVEAMNDCKLIDIGYHGSKYTWSNNRKNNLILERLDRGWANDAWLSTFPNASLWHLPKITSDHCPIHLQLDSPIAKLGQKPFRFEPMWLNEPTFHDIVATAWVKEEGGIDLRLDNVKTSLISWNKNVFGIVYVRKRKVLARLRGVQIALHNNPTSPFLQNLEQDLIKELEIILRRVYGI